MVASSLILGSAGGAAGKPIAEPLGAKKPEAILQKEAVVVKEVTKQEIVSEEDKGEAKLEEEAVEAKAEEKTEGVVVGEEAVVVQAEKTSVETAAVAAEEEEEEEEKPIVTPVAVVEQASPRVGVQDGHAKKKADGGRELSREVISDALRGIASTILSILSR